MIKKWDNFFNEPKDIDVALKDIKDILIDYEDGGVKIFSKDNRIYIKVIEDHRNILNKKVEEICNRLNTFKYTPRYQHSKTYETINPKTHNICYINIITLHFLVGDQIKESNEDPLDKVLQDVKDILIDYEDNNQYSQYDIEIRKGTGENSKGIKYPFVNICISYKHTEEQIEQYNNYQITESGLYKIANDKIKELANIICGRLKTFGYHPNFNTVNTDKCDEFTYSNDIRMVIGTNKLNESEDVCKPKEIRPVDKLYQEVKDILIEFEDDEKNYGMRMHKAIDDNKQPFIAIRIIYDLSPSDMMYSLTSIREIANKKISVICHKICDRLIRFDYNAYFHKVNMVSDTMTSYYNDIRVYYGTKLNESKDINDTYQDIKDILIEYEDDSRIIMSKNNRDNKISIKIGRLPHFKNYEGKKDLLRTVDKIEGRLKSHGYSTERDNIHNMVDSNDFDTYYHTYITIYDNKLNESKDTYQDIKDILIEYEDDSIIQTYEGNNAITLKVGKMPQFKGYEGRKELMKTMDDIEHRLKDNGYIIDVGVITPFISPEDFETYYYVYITIYT